MLFQRIPVVSSANLPYLNAASIVPLSDAFQIESIYDFWDLPNLEGRSNNILLSDTGTPLVVSADFLTKNTDYGNFISTGYSDNSEFTVLAALRFNSAPPLSITLGNIGTPVSEGWGASLVAGSMKINLRGTSTNTAFGSVTTGEWFYVAISIGSIGVKCSILGQAASAYDVPSIPTGYVPSSNDIVLGNSQYNSATANNGTLLDVGYLVISEAAISVSDQLVKLQAVKDICVEKGLV